MLEVRPIPATGSGGEILRIPSAQSLMRRPQEYLTQGLSAFCWRENGPLKDSARRRRHARIWTSPAARMMRSPDLSADRNSHSIWLGIALHTVGIWLELNGSFLGFNRIAGWLGTESLCQGPVLLHVPRCLDAMRRSFSEPSRRHTCSPELTDQSLMPVLMSSWLLWINSTRAAGRSRITHHAFALAGPCLRDLFSLCAVDWCRFRLLIKQVQAVTSLAITFFDVWALRMLPTVSAPLSGTVFALPGTPAFEQSSPEPQDDGGTLGRTSCSPSRFSATE